MFAPRFQLAGLLLLATLIPSTSATPLLAQTEGDYLYNVAMLRAAPGHFIELIDALEESALVHAEAGDIAPFWIRHSQGDQWDLMLIYPMDSFESYFSARSSSRRASVWESDRGRALATRLKGLIAFKEEWFATSTPVDELARRFDGMGMFHVEMFAGIAGKRAELLEQRRMENAFYGHLGRQLNVVFVRESGPNWDAMTIGFYPDLQSFAEAGARFSETQQDEAARAAGFDGVGAISPFLRSLLSYHHDTIAVRVR